MILLLSSMPTMAADYTNILQAMVAELGAIRAFARGRGLTVQAGME
jgi:hypothetical protein